jgi:hypothetical protein
MLEKREESCCLDSCGSGQESVRGCCEQGSEPSGSTKGGEFLNYLSDYQLLKKDSAPCT